MSIDDTVYSSYHSAMSACYSCKSAM